MHSPIENRVWFLRPKTGETAKSDIPPYNKIIFNQSIIQFPSKLESVFQIYPENQWRNLPPHWLSEHYIVK